MGYFPKVTSAGMRRGAESLRRFILSSTSAALIIATTPAPLQAQQPPPPPPGAAGQDAPQPYAPQQLDALLAPIALYPDQLLTQVLMACTYPAQITDAARWAADRNNQQIKGDQLTQALAPFDWDPSVKSLVPFPQVLATLSAQPDWVQQLGYAMAVQQSDVMDSVQRLRRQAQNAGNLQSTQQQVVSSDGPAIVIAPAQPQIVYVPAYNPAVVYGAWDYPDYPPVYFPPPIGYGYGTALGVGLAFGIGVGITAGLWGWARPNWGGRNVFVNVNNYNRINFNRPPINTWRGGGSFYRPGGGFVRPPIRGPVGHPGGGFGFHPGPGARPGVGPRPGIPGGRPAFSPPGRPGGTRPGIPGSTKPTPGKPGSGGFKPPPGKPEPGKPSGGGSRPSPSRPGGGNHTPGSRPPGGGHSSAPRPSAPRPAAPRPAPAARPSAPRPAPAARPAAPRPAPAARPAPPHNTGGGGPHKH